METDYLAILKRAGHVLLVVGLLDIGLMLYCFAVGMSYASSFNIFAVIAGILLMRGNLEAAAVVRFLAVFLFVAFAGVIPAVLLIQPLDLTMTYLRLSPVSSLGAAGLAAGVLLLLGWLAHELGSEPVQAARAQAGRKRQGARIPAALGLAVPVFLGVGVSFLLRGETAEHAKLLAREQVGANYRLHVSSLSVQWNGSRTTAEGVVVAWNDNEIRQVPVHWEEH
jgi:hypothetical protein